MRFVGGFFGIELSAERAGGSATPWNLPEDPELTYANGRSALAALLASVNPPRLWLPAYVCRSVAEAALGIAVEYFPVDEMLEPDTAFLSAAVAAGDMVLAVDYFGRAPDAVFRAFVRDRQDVGFIEDACQAIDTGGAPWGRWRLHSPRKLVGVADGGFVVPAEAIDAERRSTAQADLRDTSVAARLRFEDEDEGRQSEWHTANQAREAAETVTRGRMSRLSFELLRRMPVAQIAARRQANYRLLAAALHAHRFLPDDPPGFVPLGFPIRLPPTAREPVRHALIAAGIFPAIHWQELPSPLEFSVAHRLSQQLLTLPCDHRYGAPEMARIVDVLHAVLPTLR